MMTLFLAVREYTGAALVAEWQRITLPVQDTGPSYRKGVDPPLTTTRECPYSNGDPASQKCNCFFKKNKREYRNCHKGETIQKPTKDKIKSYLESPPTRTTHHPPSPSPATKHQLEATITLNILESPRPGGRIEGGPTMTPKCICMLMCGVYPILPKYYG